MNFFSDKWLHFVLRLLFWIFAWTLHDTIMKRYDLSNTKKIVLYTSLLFTVVLLIKNTKGFF